MKLREDRKVKNFFMCSMFKKKKKEKQDADKAIYRAGIRKKILKNNIK